MLDFDEIVYNLTLFFNGGISIRDIKVKINDGTPIKIYDMQMVLQNVELYKIEFIKQNPVLNDVIIEYQGFVRR